MKTLRMTAGLVCCCIISNILLRAETAPSTEFTVSGAVVSDGGGEPLARMRVSLITAQPGSQLQRETVTGEDGRFRFSVPEGRYSLTASRNGIPRQIYGGLAGFGSAVITGPGKPSVNLHSGCICPR